MEIGNGNTPYYNNIMGVFNLSGKPNVISGNVAFYMTGPWEYPPPMEGQYYYSSCTENSYTIDNNSYTIQWNPAVINNTTNGATIQNLKKQIIVLLPINQTAGGPFSTENFPQENIDMGDYVNGNYAYIPNGYGTVETIGKYSAAVSVANSSSPLLIDSPEWGFNLIGVRFSFDVVPNNGAPKSTIVKTFLANIINQ
jgi:hypothetical protein